MLNQCVAPNAAELPEQPPNPSFCISSYIMLMLDLLPPVEFVAAGGFTRSAYQHPAASGGDAAGAEFRHVHHGGAHVLPHVLQLPQPCCAADEAE